jgi:hypothetical protein
MIDNTIDYLVCDNKKFRWDKMNLGEKEDSKNKRLETYFKENDDENK